MSESTAVALALYLLVFIGGLALSPILRARWYQWRRRKRHEGDIGIAKVTPQVRASIWAFITLSAAVAVVSWYAQYYVQQNHLSPLLGNLASTIFGLAVAGFIGQVVFELLLRTQLLDQTSSVLAKTVLMDKETLLALFSLKRIGEIAGLCLGVLAGAADSGSDKDIKNTAEEYGRQLFLRAQAQIDGAALKPIRKDFADRINFHRIQRTGDDDDAVLDRFLGVQDNLTFTTSLPYPYFRAGIASNTEQLYELFDDPSCIYRWLLSSDEGTFEKLMKWPEYFKVEVRLGDDGRILCPIVPEATGLTKRGYEIVFRHPDMKGFSAGFTIPERVSITAKTLHSRQEHMVSVHLAYPVVNSTTISLFSQDAFTGIDAVTFFYGRDPKREKMPNGMGLTFEVVGSRWAMPGEGVVFFWE